MSLAPRPRQIWRRRRDAAAFGAAERLRSARLFALFFAGCLLFGPPALGLFSQPRLVLGVPVLLIYVFAAWAVFIALIALLTEGGRRGDGA